MSFPRFPVLKWICERQLSFQRKSIVELHVQSPNASKTQIYNVIVKPNLYWTQSNQNGFTQQKIVLICKD